MTDTLEAKTCKQCGAGFPAKVGPGRPQAYCTKKCRNAAGKVAAAQRKAVAVAT